MAQAKDWKITTLEWPPFSCSDCPEGGAAIKALRDVLKSKGITVKFEFLPWTRAIKVARSEGYVGYYPSWQADVIDGFKSSEVIFKSPIAFLENKEKPLGDWKELSDLKGKTIGVVQDYGYSKPFLKLIDKKNPVIKAEYVAEPSINIKKIAAARFDATLIDVNVAKYYLSKKYAKYASKVQIQKKHVANLDLLIAVKNSEFDKYNKILKDALKDSNAQKIIDKYLLKYYK